jgi:hypothetical protein
VFSSKDEICHFNDRLIAPQLGPLHEKVRNSHRDAMFFGIPSLTGADLHVRAR